MFSLLLKDLISEFYLMWVSEPHTDHEWWSCHSNGRSLYLNAEEEPECQVGELQQACSVYRRTETDLVSICLRRPRPVVCCCRSKPLTNKLPWLADGVHCFIEESLEWTFSPQPTSSRGSSHSISLSKPNASEMMHLQSKNKTCHPHLQEINYTNRVNWCPTVML